MLPANFRLALITKNFDWREVSFYVRAIMEGTVRFFKGKLGGMEPSSLLRLQRLAFE